MLVFNFLKAADAGSNDYSCSGFVFFFEINAAVGNGLYGTCDGKLSKTVHPLGQARTYILFDAEILYLASEMYGIFAGIERLDLGYSAYALTKRAEQPLR
jgi:hypothetical protein